MKGQRKFILQHLFLIFNLLLIYSYSTAQGVTQDVQLLKGNIIDSISGNPIEFATVHLKVLNGAFEATTLSDKDGAFKFSLIPKGKYDLSVGMMGYNKKKIELDIDRNDFKLETIRLSVQTNQLKETVIIGNKPIISQKPGKLVYEIQSDPDSKSKSLLEIMPKIPYLSVDGNNNLLMKGSPDFKIFIDGKPSNMVANNLNEVLRSIPASTIQRIEVLTTPPSKYDAEGTAGIINIITIKTSEESYKGTVNLKEEFPVGGPAIGTNYTLRKGKFGLSFLGGGGFFRTPKTNNSYNRETGSPISTLVQMGSNKNNSKSVYGGIGLSFQADTSNLLTGNVNFSRGITNGMGDQRSVFNDGSGMEQSYSINNTNSLNRQGIDASIGYQLTSKKSRASVLSFLYQYVDNQNKLSSNISLANMLNYGGSDYNQYNSAIAREHTVQIDYALAINKVVAEAGVKSIFRNNKSNFIYNLYNTESGLYEMVNDESDHFDYHQNVYSAYNTYTFQLGEWNFVGGIRAELTDIASDLSTSQIKYGQRYFNVLPSLAIGKSYVNGNSLNFGFAQRIRRPGINRLNPFIDRSNPNVETVGNPNLKPVLINDLSISYSMAHKLSTTIGAGYTILNKVDLPVSSFDSISNITKITYNNNGKVQGLNAFLSINYPITNRLTVGFNGSVIYFWIQGFIGSSSQKSEFLTHSFSASASYGFNNGWKVNCSLYTISRNPNSFQGYTNSITRSSFSVNKEIIKNNLTLSVLTNNPFSKYRKNRTTAAGPDFNDVLYQQQYFRSFSLSLNHTFGRGVGRILKRTKEIRNDDIQNIK